MYKELPRMFKKFYKSEVDPEIPKILGLSPSIGNTVVINQSIN